MILLQILKVIGIIILSLLAIFLFLVLAIMFVPVRYKLKASYFDKLLLHLQGSWFIRIISFYIDYDKALTYDVRLLGFHLFSNIEDNARSKKDDFSVTAKNKKPYSEEDFFDEEDDEENVESSKNSHEVNENTSSDSRTESDINSKEKEAASFDKSKDITKEKAKEKIKNVKSSKSLGSKLKRIIDLLRKEENKKLLLEIKHKLYSLFKLIMPKKLRLRAKYSLASPDYTALAYGFLCMFPMGYKNRWEIETDFDTEEIYIKGDTEISGRIVAFPFFQIIFYFYTNKEIRKLYHKIKRIMEG